MFVGLGEIREMHKDPSGKSYPTLHPLNVAMGTREPGKLPVPRPLCRDMDVISKPHIWRYAISPANQTPVQMGGES